MDIDSDGDGFLDRVDNCVKTPGVAPDGCPPPPPIDTATATASSTAEDNCVDVPGTAPDGCPDSDGDGFKDKDDKCPQVAGVAPDGCPSPDKDGDGILDANDKCIDIPETKNGYQDARRLPRRGPQGRRQVRRRHQGHLLRRRQGHDQAQLQATLDAAVKVLKDFPDVNVEISGHTDSDGDREHNVDLSRAAPTP
jgi:hypothetical protein